jgi:uncharacterized protein (DUF305 family)
MRTISLILAAAALVTMTGPSAAQTTDTTMDHSAHGMAGPISGAMGQMMTAMDTMMTTMPSDSSSNVDADFLLMMIPHHQAAVDMARVVIAEGADPETRTLAEAVITAQEAEIAQMRNILDRLGIAAPAN